MAYISVKNRKENPFFTPLTKESLKFEVSPVSKPLNISLPKTKITTPAYIPVKKRPVFRFELGEGLPKTVKTKPFAFKEAVAQKRQAEIFGQKPITTLDPTQPAPIGKIVTGDYIPVGIRVKVPFIQAGFTLPADTSGELLKDFYQSPEKIVKSIIYHNWTPEEKEAFKIKEEAKAFQSPLYQKDYKEMVDRGVNPVGAFILTGIDAAVDATIFADLVGKPLIKMISKIPVKKSFVAKLTWKDVDNLAIGKASNETMAALYKQKVDWSKVIKRTPTKDGTWLELEITRTKTLGQWLKEQQPGFTVKDVSKLDKAKNAMSKTGAEKPGGVARAMAELQKGISKPVRIRTLEDGTLFIEDGTHRIEAAKRLGLKELPTEDVTSFYKPDLTTQIQKAKAEGKSFEEFIGSLSEGRRGLAVDYTPTKRLLADIPEDTPISKFVADKEITIYRGISGDVQKEIIDGDFVTTSMSLAETYGDEVISKTVKTKDVFIEGTSVIPEDFAKGLDDLHLEAVYNSSKPISKSRLKQLWEGEAKPVKAIEVPKKEVKQTTLSGFKNFANIRDVKRKDIPYKELGIAELIRNDKVFPAIRRSGFFAEKEFQTAPIRDLYKQSLSPHHMALAQDGFKKGELFGEVFKKIWLPTQKAIRSEKEFITRNTKNVGDIGKRHKIKATEKNLEHLSDVMEGKVKAVGNENAYVKELRAYLDDLRNQANEVRELMGKPKIGYINDYIPHIQKATLWNELLSNKATISDNLDFIIPNQVKNPFSYKRMMQEMPKAERNLYILLDRYIGAISKDIYMTPAIESIKAYNGVIKNRELLDSSRYWDEYIRTGLIGKQHKLDISLSIGQKGKKALKKWNNMVNLAFLTGKVAWNVATQPLSYIMNVPMEVGIKNSIKAIFKSFSKPLRQYVKENSDVLNIKSSDVRSVAVGEGRNIQNRIYRTKINKYNDFISMLGSVEERELTLASYVAGLERAKQLGYKGEEALWYADLTAARTQSMYNKENRALILNSDVTRAIFPFQSFSIEMFNHLKEISTKASGAMQLTYRQRIGKLYGLIVGLFLANWYSEKLTGNKKTTIGTFIPFLGSFVDQLYAKAIGKEYYGGRSPITVFQIGEDVIRGSRDYIKHGSLKRLRKVAVNFGLALGGLGGGGQINNIIDGLMATINEDVKNVSGKTLFNVEDTMSKIKAPFFGVWATKEGIEYWQPEKDKSRLEEIEDRIEKMQDKSRLKEFEDRIKSINNK